MIGGVPRLSTPMPELPEAWELGESLGIGSFGSVWRVSHRETSEQGAVKVLPRPEENTHKLMRITTEIATMERSCRGCPFILQLREVHTMERHILIVMELAAGGELLVDFSPKNGPPSASGRVRGGGAEIAWPDGNVWTRFEAGGGRLALRPLPLVPLWEASLGSWLPLVVQRPLAPPARSPPLGRPPLRLGRLLSHLPWPSPPAAPWLLPPSRPRLPCRPRRPSRGLWRLPHPWPRSVWLALAPPPPATSTSVCSRSRTTCSVAASSSSASPSTGCAKMTFLTGL